jgi:hypothetical protein
MPERSLRKNKVSPAAPTRLKDVLGDHAFRVHTQGLATTTVRDFDALIPHSPAWDRLVWDAPQKAWTLLPGNVDAVLRHKLKPNESWLCSFAYVSDRLVGALPVIVTPHPLLGRHWPQLRPVCDDVALASDCPTTALKALLAELAREVPHHVGLSLRNVRHNSPVWLALRQGVDGYVVYGGPCYRFWLLDVKGGFDRYWASLGNMRKNLRYRRRKLLKRGAISVEMRKGESAGEDFLAEFLALEASGWKGRMGTAILNKPDDVALYTTLVRNFARQGRLEWHGIRVDGRLIAGELGVRCGDALILPKYAYDEDFAECSPGQLLTEEVFKEAFSRDDLVEVNTMSYERQSLLWHMTTDSYADVNLVRRNVPSLLFHYPRVVAKVAFHDHVLQRIPVAAKRAYRQFKRGEYRKLFRSISSGPSTADEDCASTASRGRQ